ncbi:uncharacterized protein [Clytia hemisphaerica]|uniref:uncharacterized protein n=1 Tax=Clytia hemisphaerica TaxID=252671 RepID=UPI0034D70DD3
MAVRLVLRDHENRDIGVFLISTYAPVGNAPEDEWDLYFDQLSSCIAKKHHNDILLIGSDTNSSMGTSSENEDPVGNFGISHINNSGRRYRSYLSINNLSAMTSCFKKNEYGTWIHPRSKKPHQIDHFIVNRQMTHRVRDAGVTACLLDSDHRAIFIKLKIMIRLKKKSDLRSKVTNLDISALSDVTKRNNFCENVARKFNDSDSNARKKLKALITKSKNDWILSHCSRLNRHHGTKPAWESLKALNHGLSKPKHSVSRQMKKPNGALCSTPQENATVFYEHFNNLYNREENFNVSVLDPIPHHDIVQGCDHDPTEDEIRKAITKIKEHFSRRLWYTTTNMEMFD